MTIPKNDTGRAAALVAELGCSVPVDAGTENHPIQQPPVAYNYQMALALPKGTREN